MIGWICQPFSLGEIRDGEKLEDWWNGTSLSSTFPYEER